MWLDMFIVKLAQKLSNMSIFQKDHIQTMQSYQWNEMMVFYASFVHIV